MRKLAVFYLVCMMPMVVLAAGSSGSGGSQRSRLDLNGFYGMGGVSPTDLNGIQQGFAGSPSGISAATVYGGGLGLRFAHRWLILAKYTYTTAKNLSSVGTGFEIKQSSVWGNLDYFLVPHGPLQIYIGAGAGSPTWTQVTAHNGTDTNYSASNSVGYSGQAGLEIPIGFRANIFFEGAYLVQKSGNVTNSAGANLLNTSGATAIVDLSGFRADAGINLLF